MYRRDLLGIPHVGLLFGHILLQHLIGTAMGDEVPVRNPGLQLTLDISLTSGCTVSVLRPLNCMGTVELWTGAVALGRA